MKPCDCCGELESARERGNGQANWCGLCIDKMIDAYAPGMRKRAEFGRRALIAYRRECLLSDGEINDSGEGAYRLKDAVAVAVCSLGLLDDEDLSE